MVFKWEVELTTPALISALLVPIIPTARVLPIAAVVTPVNANRQVAAVGKEIGNTSLMKAWINHFALNLGAALTNLFFAIIPPQFTGHTESDLQELEASNLIKSFLIGLRGE